ncbi:hypothetical protein AVEN_199949-1, partial [Araneus ventricosus]
IHGELNDHAYANSKFGFCSRRIIVPIATGTCDDPSCQRRVIGDGPIKADHHRTHQKSKNVLTYPETSHAHIRSVPRDSTA